MKGKCVFGNLAGGGGVNLSFKIIFIENTQKRHLSMQKPHKRFIFKSYSNLLFFLTFSVKKKSRGAPCVPSKIPSISNINTPNGSPRFANGMVVIRYFLSLPFLYAVVEPFFIVLKNIKTDFWNRLSFISLRTAMQTKAGMRRINVHSESIILNQSWPKESCRSRQTWRLKSVKH